VKKGTVCDRRWYHRRLATLRGGDRGLPWGRGRTPPLHPGEGEWRMKWGPRMSSPLEAGHPGRGQQERSTDQSRLWPTLSFPASNVFCCCVFFLTSEGKTSSLVVKIAPVGQHRRRISGALGCNEPHSPACSIDPSRIYFALFLALNGSSFPN